jgi:uncharacterized membrane protein
MTPPRRELVEALRQPEKRTGPYADHSLGALCREAAAALEQSLTDIARLREALEKIARYDVGHQALVEEGQATPTRLATYYASQVERRRKLARAALKAGVDD